VTRAHGSSATVSPDVLVTEPTVVVVGSASVSGTVVSAASETVVVVESVPPHDTNKRTVASPYMILERMSLLR
jgi:hypothetical protein